MQALKRAFYNRDPLVVAREMLGALLIHEHPERGSMVGRVVETEAYRDVDDKACHAHKGKTARTEPMFGPPGHAYVYLIYGMYNMFNVVTWPRERPAAVLVRGVEPVMGIDGTTDGPGKLTRSMDIDRTLNTADLTGHRIFLAADAEYPDSKVCCGPRIGVDYAGEWAQKPWRFYVRSNRWVSKPR